MHIPSSGKCQRRVSPEISVSTGRSLHRNHSLRQRRRSRVFLVHPDVIFLSG
jgi:hypothetical protein